MTKLNLLAATGLALALSACAQHKTFPAQLGRLDCPAQVGDLTRTAQAADGKSCAYTGGKGGEVALSLVPVAGTVQATLAGIEAALPQSMPGTEVATPEPPKVEAPADTDDDEAKSADKAEEKAIAKLEAHGVRVDKSGDHESVRIDIPGVHIEAGGDDKANVKAGPLTINADKKTAVIKIYQDVRLRGEGFSSAKNGVRASFIHASPTLPDGYHFVGYRAEGAKAGPLVVAMVKSKAPHADNGLPDDVKKLVKRNSGL